MVYPDSYPMATQANAKDPRPKTQDHLSIHDLRITIPRHALVAQLDRASDFESEGRRFEPCRVHHFKLVPSQKRRKKITKRAIP
jgi:hypothetical protein